MHFNNELLISLKARIIDLEEIIHSTGVERGLNYLPQHQGDIEAIVKILSKYYGESKDYSGWDLLNEVIKNTARKKDNKIWKKIWKIIKQKFARSVEKN
jgi:hypothetical protein